MITYFNQGVIMVEPKSIFMIEEKADALMNKVQAQFSLAASNKSIVFNQGAKDGVRTCLSLLLDDGIAGLAIATSDFATMTGDLSIVDNDSETPEMMINHCQAQASILDSNDIKINYWKGRIAGVNLFVEMINKESNNG